MIFIGESLELINVGNKGRKIQTLEKTLKITDPRLMGYTSSRSSRLLRGASVRRGWQGPLPIAARKLVYGYGHERKRSCDANARRRLDDPVFMAI